MLDELVQGVLDFCGREDTRRLLEAKLLDPALLYLQAKFHWLFIMFQVLTALVVLQTALLTWMLFRTATWRA